MKQNRFTESQIVSILKQQEAGSKVMDICREHGISDATFYNWKAKYGGMDASQLKKLKEMESELSQLKRMYADLALENRAMKDLIEKKLSRRRSGLYERRAVSRHALSHPSMTITARHWPSKSTPRCAPRAWYGCWND